MIAIVSDIHSNLEALLVVLDDIAARNVEEIVCLGDLVGYGANPCECIDLIQQNAKVTVRGNHDEAVLNKDYARDFNLKAEGALDWTRAQLETGNSTQGENHRRIDFLTNLPERADEGDITFVHGSPRAPTRDYIFPRDVRSKEKMQEIFALFARFCFVGQ